MSTHLTTTINRFALCAAMLAFAACGSDTGNNTKAEAPSTPAAETAQTTASEPSVTIGETSTVATPAPTTTVAAVDLCAAVLPADLSALFMGASMGEPSSGRVSCEWDSDAGSLSVGQNDVKVFEEDTLLETFDDYLSVSENRQIDPARGDRGIGDRSLFTSRHGVVFELDGEVYHVKAGWQVSNMIPADAPAIMEQIARQLVELLRQ